MTLLDAAGERPPVERPQNVVEFGRMKGGGRRRDQLLGFAEQRVRRRFGARLRGDPEVGRGGTGHRLRRSQVYAGAVILGRHARPCLLAVAGPVGGQRQELVALTRLALVDHRSGSIRELPLPDSIVAAVGGHVQRHMPQARSALVIRSLPLELIVVAGFLNASDRQRGARCHSVHGLGDHGGVFRRCVVEQHAGAGRDLVAGLHHIGIRQDRIGHKARTLPLGVVGRQQAPVGVLQQLARQRIDGLQKPRRLARELIDTGTDAEHKP